MLLLHRVPCPTLEMSKREFCSCKVCACLRLALANTQCQCTNDDDDSGSNNSSSSSSNDDGEDDDGNVFFVLNSINIKNLFPYSFATLFSGLFLFLRYAVLLTKALTQTMKYVYIMEQERNFLFSSSVYIILSLSGSLSLYSHTMYSFFFLV